MKKIIIFIALATLLAFGGYKVIANTNLNPEREVGEIVDTFNEVNVYYNGGVGHVLGRNLTDDGYNLGLKYQCVEFIKRYYYEHFDHKMPDSYGHAKDFFNAKLSDGEMNQQRNLIQFTNGSKAPPAINDILVYSATIFNPYGHVSIVSDVNLEQGFIEIIQQNPGPFADSREKFSLKQIDGKWTVDNKNVLGWLHKK